MERVESEKTVKIERSSEEMPPFPKPSLMLVSLLGFLTVLRKGKPESSQSQEEE